MKRRLVMLAASAAVILPCTAAPGKPVSAGAPLPLGSSHTFRQGPDALRVTVLQVLDPVRRQSLQPPSGFRLVAVKVRVRNAGVRALYPEKTTGCHALASARLIDARGSRHTSRDGLRPNLAAFFAASASPYVETPALQRGEAATGYYTFALPRKVKRALFSLAPCAGGPAQRWRLR